MKKTWNSRKGRFEVGEKGSKSRMAGLQWARRMVVQTKVREKTPGGRNLEKKSVRGAGGTS